MSRRKSPRIEVVSVYRLGAHGSVRWLHELDCGHVEERQRKAPVGEKLACVRCGEGSYEVGDEESLRRMQLKLAQALNVADDEVVLSVRNVNGTTELRQATVYLPPAVVMRLLRRG